MKRKIFLGKGLESALYLSGIIKALRVLVPRMRRIACILSIGLCACGRAGRDLRIIIDKTIKTHVLQSLHIQIFFSFPDEVKIIVIFALQFQLSAFTTAAIGSLVIVSGLYRKRCTCKNGQPVLNEC